MGFKKVKQIIGTPAMVSRNEKLIAALRELKQTAMVTQVWHALLSEVDSSVETGSVPESHLGMLCVQSKM